MRITAAAEEEARVSMVPKRVKDESPRISSSHRQINAGYNSSRRASGTS